MFVGALDGLFERIDSGGAGDHWDRWPSTGPVAPMARVGHQGRPARAARIAVGAAVDGLLSTRGVWVQDVVREPSLTGTACNRTGAAGACKTC